MAELTQTTYLILEPTYGHGNWSTEVRGFKVSGARKTRPTGEAAAGSVVIALKLTIPRAAFEPLRPEVEITVPEGAYEVHPVVQVIEPPEAVED